MLTLQEIKHWLKYNPDTGILTWRIGRGGTKAGDMAGYIVTHGYIKVGISMSEHYAHRIAYSIYHNIEYKDLPKTIDHINMDRSDNRISNLRAATFSQNLANKSISPSNTSGFKGVSWHKQLGKWRAYVKRKDKGQVHLGLFECKVQAAKAHDNAALKLHGEFAVTNKSLGLIA